MRISTGGSPASSRGMGGNQRRTTVFPMFQVGPRGALMRRKTGLSARSEDTLQRVYDTITGRFGGRPLWPTACADEQAKGAVACFLVCTTPEDPESEAALENWRMVPPEATLLQLEQQYGSAVKLLLRVQAPDETREAAEAVFCNLESSAAVLRVQGTFIHVDEEDDKPELSPRALSDPGSSYAGSHMGSHVGSLVGADDPMEDERDGRKMRSLQDQLYIRKNLHWRRPSKDSTSGRRATSVGAGSDTTNPGDSSCIEPVQDNASECGSAPAEGPRRRGDGSREKDADEDEARGFADAGRGVAGAKVRGPRRREDAPVARGGPGGLPGPGLGQGPAYGAGPFSGPHRGSLPVAQTECPLSPSITPMSDLSPFMGGESLRGQPLMISSPGSQGSDVHVFHPAGLPACYAAPPSGLPLSVSQPLEGGMATACSLDGEDAPRSCASEALFAAVSGGDAKGVAQLFRDNLDISLITGQGSHVLFRAVIKAQSIDIVNMILNYKANPRWSDAKGNQVMHFWARATSGRDALRQIGQALIDAGADVNPQRNEDGMSVLHHVVVGFNSRRGWLDFHKVLFLLRHGANPELVTHSGQTPQDLLQGEHRKSGCRLQQLLRAARQGGPGGASSWPTCERPGCPWCESI